MTHSRKARRQGLAAHVRFGGEVCNRRCPLCGRLLTPCVKKSPQPDSMATEEHLLPQAITGTRPYDLLVCRKCNNEKSRLDEAVTSLARLAPYSDLTRDGFDRQFLKHPTTLLSMVAPDALCSLPEEPTGDLRLHTTMKFHTLCVEWLRTIAKAIYFLETGKCLRQRLKPGGIFQVDMRHLAGRAISRLPQDQVPPGCRWIEGAP